MPCTGTLAQDVALTSVFTYDAAGRLTASAHSAPADLALPQGWGLGDTLGATASGYAWDANGNRTQVHHTSATGAGAATLERVFAQSADSNRLQGYTERFTPAGGALQTTQVAYSQDAAGSLTNKGDTYLHYGVDGRIAKVGASADASDTLAVGYVTNVLGQRVLKRDARLSGQDHPAITQQTVYAEDGIGSTVLGQYGNRRSADSAAPTGEMDSTEVLWLPTATGPMPAAAQINGRLYAIDADHLNTPRRLTNAQGQVVWQWLIAGFGEANPTTGVTGYAQDGAASGRSYGEAVRFDLRYAGQVWDEETGLSYNLHRYYDAGTGRYVQADPIGLEGGWNRFGYVDGNPLKWIDPKGLAIPAAVIACMSNPLCAAAAGGAIVTAANACKQTWDYLSNNWMSSSSSSNPMTGEPGCEVECNNKNGNRKQTRRYGPDGFPETDTDWDHSHEGLGSPHSHDWTRPADGSRPNHGNRGNGRPSVPGDPGIKR